MFDNLSKYIKINEDKFKNQVSITQKRMFDWKDEVLSNQRTFDNSLKLEYIKIHGYLLSTTKGFRVEKCDGSIKIFIDFAEKLKNDIEKEKIILRINDSQNYPLQTAYYKITTLINDFGDQTGEWLHEWGFEIPLDLLKTICEAKSVEDNLNSDWLWQTNARLIYNIAIDNQKYNDELINLFESISQKEAEEEQYEKQFEEDTDRLYKLIKEKDKFIGHGVMYNCTVDEFIREFCSESSFSETSEKLNDLIPLREELDEILRSKYPERYEEDTYLNVLKAADSYIKQELVKQELDKKRKKRLGLTFGILAIAVTITLFCVI